MYQIVFREKMDLLHRQFRNSHIRESYDEMFVSG